MHSSPAISAINHEICLGQLPLQALSQQQRATFHWLLATLPTDLSRRAPLECDHLAVAPLSDPLLSELEQQALPLNHLFASGDDWLRAEEQSLSAATDGLAQCRLLQALTPPPLVAYSQQQSGQLPTEILDNLEPWQQQRQQPLPEIPALPAILELAAQHVA